MKRILLYGAGSVAQYIYNHYIDIDSVVGIIQTNKDTEKWNSVLVHNASDLRLLRFDELWLANADIETLHIAIKNGVPKEKLIICNKLMCDAYCVENDGILDIKYLKVLAEEYEQALYLSKGQIITTTME